MSTENDLNEDVFDENDANSDAADVIPLSGLYEEWFLDYASYVILERAVPALEDGLKPVQRRILHSLKELDDGRYNKVANVIGNTMKYHPHGDASIGDAMVQIGQKELLIDCQGNWGNTLTGDGAAAPRYIEARLTKFALHVVFNPKTTEWLSSYDGRNKEPKNLPVKFPLLLSQGAEGIAVGMACKILPHNFIELIDASIDHLRGRKVDIYPDFPHGGKADFSNYNEGLRGGKVRVRANITKLDSKTLKIDQIPYGTTTDILIESIVKATEKNKIKVRKIEDNTAAEAEILIHLPPGISPDKMIDALYAFTNCEISISPNAAVIENTNTPVFIGVNEMLRNSTDRTVGLLKMELEIKKRELESQWHWASLERIFIENRIYRDIEEEETWEGVIQAIDSGMHKFISTPSKVNKGKGVISLFRDLTEEDIVRLTEIKIKRISKFDANKADELIAKILTDIEEVQHHLDNLIQYAVDYFKDLKIRFGEGKERKTEIRAFDNISAKKVIVSNKKLYVDKEEGFMGWALRKDEYVSDCSEIDDIIVFFDTGKMLVTNVVDKKFVGKGIIHIAVWKKGDKRTIYHMIYQDGKDKAAYMKRFHVNSITKDKEYDLTAGNKGSKLLYFTANPNGRKEIVSVKLRPRPHLKKIRFDIDFGELLIKGRGSKGNRATKEIISKIEQKEVGGSTLAARKVWWDDVVRRLNDEGRGTLLGQFRGDDKILTLHDTGHYRLSGFELATKFGDDLIHIEKWHPDRPISCVYWNQEKEMYYVKRFLAELSSKPVLFISEEEGALLTLATTQKEPVIQTVYNKHLRETKHLPDKIEVLNELIEVKGLKAQGNQLTKLKVKSISLLPPEEGEDWEVDEIDTSPDQPTDDPELLEDEIEEEIDNEESDDEDLDTEDTAHDDLDDSDDDDDDDSEEDDNDDDDSDDDDDDQQGNNPANKVKPELEEGPIEMEWDLEVPQPKKEAPKKESTKKGSKGAIKPSDNEEDQMKLF